MFDYTVFIGRFQPVHNGHLKVIHQALSQSDRLIILVGSANRARDIRNPFSYYERVEMINLCLTSDEQARVFYCALDDYMYQDSAWVENVQLTVDRVVSESWFYPKNINPSKIALIGHAKDHTGYFLKLFPQWNSIPVVDPKPINSTNIRDNMFNTNEFNTYEIDNLPEPVFNYIDDWTVSNNSEYTRLVNEYSHNLKYKKQWSVAPYPVIHHTVDALVEQSGHVLLVRRGGMPGEGLLALPGGFLNQNETLLNGAIRELLEETKIDVPEKVLRGCIVNSHTFDDPHRSTRGRTITNTIHIKLEDRASFPRVKGSDDAKKALWVPWSQWKCEETFEDHWFQGQYFKK